MTSDCGGVTSVNNNQKYTLRHMTEFVTSTMNNENSWVKVLRENCTEFVDSCGAIPKQNNLLTSITIPVNYFVNVEIRTKTFTTDKDRNIFHMADDAWTQSSGGGGRRFFSMWLDEDTDEDFWIRKMDKFLAQNYF